MMYNDQERWGPGDADSLGSQAQEWRNYFLWLGNLFRKLIQRSSANVIDLLKNQGASRWD